jgi:hypothetical protein
MNNDAEIILARCRAAVCRLRCFEFDIEEAATLLKAGRISTAGAVVWLRDNDVYPIVFPESLNRDEEAVA